MYAQWHAMTLAEQLGNIGSDFERALRWKANGKRPLLTAALARTLAQIDLTLSDQRWAGARRREIARLRDEVCSEILYRNNPTSAASLKKYFLIMGVVARTRTSTRVI